ncbi:MAG: SpoIID/LytB domain-containing protein, partial [Coriobacteriia bacterium]|nr:SpoIID/LytB domain-containing protein [Coriobacteriia bacterium]
TFNGANGPYVFTVRNGNIRMTPRTGSVVDFGSSIRITSNGSGGNQRSVTQLLTVMDQSGPPLPSASHRFVRYRGTLELTVVDGRLRLVNELPMQQYLFGVVPREIPSSAAVRTAVEAQAIAARSFAHGQTGLAQGVHSTTTFQVYGGNSRFSSEANWRSGSNVIFNEIDVSNTAVTNTGNRVILSNGNIARAYYSLCNADRTANNEDVWGGTRVAHLRSVADPFCGRDRNHPHNWTVTMTGMELANTLRLRGSTVPNGAGSTVFVTNLSSDRATGGWVRTLTVTWSNGTTTQIGNADRVRTRLGFRSSNFSVARSFPTARATVAPLASSEIMPMMSMDLLLEEALEELEMGDYSPFEITQEMRNYEEDCENSMSCQGTEETVRE